MLSTAVQPLTTVVDKIPIHRRLTEIMKDKGKHYSLRAVAARVGINREEFRRMLVGRKDLRKVDLYKIVDDLGLPLERVMQTDIQYDSAQIEWCLKNLKNLGRAKELAESVLEVSLGVTEKCVALNNLGRVLYEMRQHAHAHELWCKAHQLATESNIEDNSELYNKILGNLLLSYTMLKDYHNAVKIMEQVQVVSGQRADYMADCAYTLAMISYDQGDYEGCKEQLEKSLELYRTTGEKDNIAISIRNVANINYVLGNLIQSKHLYEQAIGMMENLVPIRLRAVKDYAKVLLKLGYNAEAEIVVMNALEEIKAHMDFDLQAKLLLLLALIRDDADIVIPVLKVEISRNMRNIVHEFLIQNYAEKGDLESSLKYYILMGKENWSASPIYDKEGF